MQMDEPVGQLELLAWLVVGAEGHFSRWLLFIWSGVDRSLPSSLDRPAGYRIDAAMTSEAVPRTAELGSRAGLCGDRHTAATRRPGHSPVAGHQTPNPPRRSGPASGTPQENLTRTSKFHQT
jgi:hypothetical protein